MNIIIKWSKLSLKWSLAVTIFFLVSSIFAVVVISIIWYLATQLIYSYGIIIDAGSTSSKVYLYSWPEIASRTNGEVFEVFKCKSTPGISDFVENVNNAYIGIKYCLEEKLLPKIPHRLRKKSFVYLGATAGMRLVKKVNVNATSQIFEAVEKYLLTTPLKFNKSPNDIKIISGVVEGLGAWISVNYLEGTLQNSKLSNFIFEKDQTTYGALDLGGASTQIAFVPYGKTNKIKENTIRLYGYNYSVYSHSYLCYGRIQAEYRHLANLLQNMRKKYGDNIINQPFLAVKNPCMLKGDTFVYPLKKIIAEPCISGEYAISNFGYDKSFPSKFIGAINNVTFQGSGDAYECQIYIEKLFSTNKCDFESCSFNNIYRPNLTNRFLAFSGFNFVYKLLREKSKKELNFTEFQTKANEYCKEEPPVIDDTDPRKIKTEIFRKWRCFDFLYVFNLLKNYGFNEHNWKFIQFKSKIKNAYLGWSLGYMINKTALVPIEQPLISMNFGAFLGLLIFFLFILFLGLLCAFLTFRQKRSINSRRSQLKYSNIQLEKSPEEISLCKA